MATGQSWQAPVWNESSIWRPAIQNCVTSTSPLVSKFQSLLHLLSTFTTTFMASRTPPPARPIPAAPVTSESAGQPVNEVAVNQTQNAVVSDIVTNNDAKGIRTYNLSPNATPEDLTAATSKAKAALGLPSVMNQTADKGAQGVYILSFHVGLSCCGE